MDSTCRTKTAGPAKHCEHVGHRWVEDETLDAEVDVGGPAEDNDAAAESRAMEARLCLAEVLEWMEEVDDVREWANTVG